MTPTAKERDRRQGRVGLLSTAAAIPAGLFIWWADLSPTPTLRAFQEAFLMSTSALLTIALDVGFCALLIALAWRLAQRVVGVDPAAQHDGSHGR